MPAIDKYSKYGEQLTEFSKVTWNDAGFLVKQSDHFKTPHKPGLIQITCSPEYRRSEVIEQKSTKLNASGYTFIGKNLEDIRLDVGSLSLFRDTFWSCLISEENHPPGAPKPSGRIKISDVMANHVTGNLVTSHGVFDSIEFKDIIVELNFHNNTHKEYIYLDADSPNYIAGLKPVVIRYGGVHGNKQGYPQFPTRKPDIDDRYQVGFGQDFRYFFKCGDIVVYIFVSFSFVFKYEFNDFEPAGVIDALKVYPQICYSHFTFNVNDHPGYASEAVNEDNEPLSTYLVDISGSLPTGVDPNSVFVKGYKGRVKMNVIVNSEWDVSKQTIGGVDYDGKYLDGLRSQGVNKIPPMFEKILDPTYYGSSNKRNILGTFSDSNHHSADNRLIPPYDHPLLTPPPFWSNVFDNAKYDRQTSAEFIAVHGLQTQSSGIIVDNKFVDRKNSFTFPKDNYEQNFLEILKMPRQGAYDNIHLHGYLGHYKDNNQLIVHAPVCGFCCFHLHWRWSPFNNEVAMNPMTIAVKGFNNSENFLGWNRDLSNQEAGAPLIPWNHHLKIAITPPTHIPVNELDTVVLPNSNIPLDFNTKSIWYCSDILEIGQNKHHVVFEQGCGYAFQYSKVGHLIVPLVFKNSVQTLMASVTPLTADYFTDYILPDEFGINTSNYQDYLHEIRQDEMPISLKNVKARFEIQYRLMRFFNKNYPNNMMDYADYDQIPSLSNIYTYGTGLPNDFDPDLLNYMNNMMNDIENL